MEGSRYIVSVEQRDEHDQLVEQFVQHFSDEVLMLVALCTLLCEHIEEWFHEDFDVMEPMTEDDPRNRLMSCDWRPHTVVRVRPQYRNNLDYLLRFAAAYMRTTSGANPILSVVVQQSFCGEDEAKLLIKI